MQARDVKVGEWFRASATSVRIRRVNPNGYTVSALGNQLRNHIIAAGEDHRLYAIHPDNSVVLDVTDAHKRAVDVVAKMQDVALTDLLLAAGVVPHESIEGRADQLMIVLTGSAG